MRLRERLRALLAAASPRFNTRLSTNWNKTKYACGDHSKCEFPTSKQNCLEQKDNIFTEQAPPSENACNHGFRTWLPYVCLVIPPALRLSWPTVTAGLQAMFGTLERFARRTGLTVNLDKTKVVVFGARLDVI